MGEWRKICCAVDFSDPSRFAMEEAADLAKRCCAELTLVHVYEPPPPVSMDALAAGESTLFWEALAVDLERSLAAWRAEAARRAGVPVASVLLVGRAAPEILAWAREHGTDLLVVGTHGRLGLKRLVLGSVAEHVVRQAPCPVFVIRPKELSEAALVAEEASMYV